MEFIFLKEEDEVNEDYESDLDLKNMATPAFGGYNII